MKRLCIGVNKASLTDDRGIVFTAIRDGNCWVFEGLTYANPFDAFKKLERSLKRWKEN